MNTTNPRVQLCTINACSWATVMLQLTLLSRNFDVHIGGSGGYRSDQGVQAPADRNSRGVAKPSEVGRLGVGREVDSGDIERKEVPLRFYGKR